MKNKYNSLELKKIQYIEYCMLVEIDRICKKNNIEYFLDSGTSLGAIRHSGFIPWDDDIDVGMLREDYEKFNNIVVREINKLYEVQNIYTDKYTYVSYTKIRCKNTEFVEYCNRKNKGMKGVYVDIFPYDKVPENEVERKKYIKKNLLLNKIFTYKSIPDITRKPDTGLQLIKYIMRRIIHYFCNIIPKKFIFNILNNTRKKYYMTDSNYICCLEFLKKPVILKKDRIIPLKETVFEDQLFPIPRDVDYYLSNMYGNYMILPSEDKRIGHSPYKIKL